MITLEEFRRIDLRVAQIVSAEKVEKPKRLLNGRGDRGDQQRTLVAGLGGHDRPEELVGLQAIVDDNLQPAVIQGIESTGMTLGVGCNDRRDLALVTVNRDAPNGAPVE